MHVYRPILSQHRFQRLVLWTLTLLHWIAAVLAGARPHARHLNQRGDVSLADLTYTITTLLIVRALAMLGRPPRCAHRWRYGRPLRCNHFRRSLLGSKLRRALKHKDLRAQIAQLIDLVRHLDKHAAHLAHRIRYRLRRYTRRGAPPIAPAALLPPPPIPAPAFSDSS